MSEHGKPGQGVGARVLRKEDQRHLHGRGNFVSDMMLPAQREVAFLRSPVAHGRVRAVRKPPGSEGTVFVRADLAEVRPIVTPSTLPTYKLSAQHPLAHGKVRFVGEPVAICVAKTRAEAEDLAERIELDLEELPALVDAHAARADRATRVHEEWEDNLFLTLCLNNGFEEESKKAVVVVKREIELSRQAMAPMEGKAVLATWDDRADQLLVYTSTQVPHMIRIGIATFLGIEEGRIGKPISLFWCIPPTAAVAHRFRARSCCAREHFAHAFTRSATLLTSNGPIPARRDATAPLGGWRGRTRPGGLGRPASQVIEDAPYDMRIVDQRDDPHRPFARREDRAPPPSWGTPGDRLHRPCG